MKNKKMNNLIEPKILKHLKRFFIYKITNTLQISFLLFFTILGFWTSETIPSELKDSELNINYFDKQPDNDYILGPGDQLLISLSKYLPEFDNFYSIDIGGSIIMPKVNRLFISGLTLDELTNLLNKKFSNIIKEPDITVRVINYRPVKVFVDGEVENPGMYVLNSSLGNVSQNSLNNRNPIFSGIGNLNSFQGNESIADEIGALGSSFQSPSSPLAINVAPSSTQVFERGPLSNSNNSFPTVFDAIKAAGGITNFSDISSIKIIRKNPISKGSGKIQTKVDFIALLNNGDISQNIRLMDEDVILIKKSENPIKGYLLKAARSNLNPKTIRIFVTGRVDKPGLVLASKSSSLNDALFLAGGTKFLKGKIYFIRYNSDGTIEKSQFRYKRNSKRGSRNNPYLKNGDIINVGKSGFNIANEVLTEITQPFLGIYTTTKIVEDLF